nr:hypothetical protein BaRGS_008802 [Batillaria attramentaria]
MPVRLDYTWLDPDADHDLIRNLTLRNWAQLKPLVVPVVFTNSSRVASRAEENGWHVLPVSRTAVDVPILKYMYMDVMARFNSTLYGYANGDILFTQSLVDTLLAVLTSPQLPIKHRPLLVAGRRTNVMMVQPNETTTFQGIYDTARSRGQMDGPFSIDYFVVDRSFPWDHIPDLIVERVSERGVDARTPHTTGSFCFVFISLDQNISRKVSIDDSVARELSTQTRVLCWVPARASDITKSIRAVNETWGAAL